FDLKQLWKTASVNTNFRVTVDGIQVGPTYLPPFTGSPISWQHIVVDLTKHQTQTGLQIGLESNVKEGYANGLGTANLIDNINIVRLVAKPTQPSGLKGDLFTSQVHLFPNPSTGTFNIELPQGKTYQLVVTDLTG